MNYRPNDPLASLRIAAEAAAYVAACLADASGPDDRVGAIMEAVDVLERRGVITALDVQPLASLFFETA